VVATPAFITAGDWISLIDDTSFVARHAENGVRRLYVVSMSTGAQRVIYTGQASRAPSPIVVSPDRQWVAFSVAVPNAGGEQIGIAALDGSSSRLVGPPMECGAGPAAWHPDGKHILAWAYPSCASEAYGEYLYLLSLNGDAPKQLTKQSGGNGEWSYSLAPDGRTVMYETSVGKGTRSIVEIDFSTALGGRGGASRRTP
jgi:Tol biopolymer transport system component